MSEEAIINQIRKDAEQEIKKIQNESKEQIKNITDDIKKETDEKRQDILEKGKQEADSLEKIEISKAKQKAKREEMQTREALIETCFQQAIQRLKELNDTRYETIIKRFIENAKKTIDDSFYIQSSRPNDETIAKQQNISVKGSVEATGGIKIISEKGSIVIDNTFEGIMKRKKHDLRVHVGNILFS